eukprot:1181313-Prorocentrum_minimum.AAC.1
MFTTTDSKPLISWSRGSPGTPAAHHDDTDHPPARAGGLSPGLGGGGNSYGLPPFGCKDNTFYHWRIQISPQFSRRPKEQRACLSGSIDSSNASRSPQHLGARNI